MNWLFESSDLIQWGLGALVNAGCLVGLVLALRTGRPKTGLKVAALGLIGVIAIGALAWILHDVAMTLADQAVAVASPSYRFEIKCRGVAYAQEILGRGLWTAALPLLIGLGLLLRGGLQPAPGRAGGPAWPDVLAMLAGLAGLSLLLVSLATYLGAGPLWAAMSLWMT
jgi:hypothetical protein